jgi:hypothetical protein
MDGRWRDAEVTLDVGFRVSAVEHVRIEVDEDQVLGLLVGEAMGMTIAHGA